MYNSSQKTVHDGLWHRPGHVYGAVMSVLCTFASKTSLDLLGCDEIKVRDTGTQHTAIILLPLTNF